MLLGDSARTSHVRRVSELLEGALLGVPAETLPPELEAQLPFAVLQDTATPLI